MSFTHAFRETLTRRISVYENERYLPVRGWSKSLLPTDRKEYTLRDGSVGWSNLHEASDALVSTGWRWEQGEDWSVIHDSSTDPEGWSYCGDFGGFADASSSSSSHSSEGGEEKHLVGSVTSVEAAEGTPGEALAENPALLHSKTPPPVPQVVGGGAGSATKNMMHFVRRRRRERHQTFDAELLCDAGTFTCSYGDLEEVERLSSILLNTLTTASLKAHPRQFNEPKCNALKSQLVQALGFDKPPITMGMYCAKSVHERLEAFASGTGSAWASMSGVLGNATGMEAVGRRTADIANAFFSHEERREIAGLIIRKHDLLYQYHCDVAQCGEECVFKVEACTNEGCHVLFSRKWAADHDLICPQKCVTCERECGDLVMRRKMRRHLDQACSLRPVQCPFLEIGCIAELVHRGLPEHLESCQTSHMLLALKRIGEQQSVIKDLYNRVQELERTQSNNGKAIAVCTTALAAADVANAAALAREVKALKRDVAECDSASSKRTQSVASELHSSTAHLQAEVNKIVKFCQETVKPDLQGKK